MKLLYAEDERAMSEAVTDILSYHKYSVDAVYDGQDALDYARNETYDGIILDVMMSCWPGCGPCCAAGRSSRPISSRWATSL